MGLTSHAVMQIYPSKTSPRALGQAGWPACMMCMILTGICTKLIIIYLIRLFFAHCLLARSWSFSTILENESFSVVNKVFFSCICPFSFGIIAWYFTVSGMLIASVNLVSSFWLSLYNLFFGLERIAVFFKCFSAHSNKSIAVRIRFCAKRCKLAFPTSLSTFTLILSPGHFQVRNDTRKTLYDRVIYWNLIKNIFRLSQGLLDLLIA